MSVAHKILSVDQLSVEFNTRNGVVQALKNVSFALEKGDVLGIVGESGSGKSVTAFSIIRLLESTGRISGGTINFDGMNFSQMGENNLKELRGREISMIFQNPRGALNPIRPVGKQIEDVLLRHAQASRQDSREKAIGMLRKVKIIDPESRYWAYPYELSGGMCQRVMIAIALSCNPRLLIADEPTTGLDVTTQKATMDLIRDLTRENNMSAILITHDLGMAAQYCDNIIVMQHGEVVESAPVEKLFAAPRHEYTRKLIAASPGPDSKLADLTGGTDHPKPAFTQKFTQKSTPRSQKVSANPFLLEVVNLVKEFPRHGSSGSGGKWWKRNQPQQYFRAVDNISFSLKRGESLGLVGESGCGKSTTSNIITRLLDPTSGDVILNGRNITAYHAALFAQSPLRTQVQMVFQDPTDSLNPRYTAKDSIAEPLKRLKQMSNDSALSKKIEELAEMVGLPQHLLTRFPHQLSGGQKARVGIARAIAVDPQLVIMDEPTSALDVSVQAVILQLLDRLKRELGMSYLFVSHDLNVVRLLCERVIVMNKGQIVEQGQTAEVLSNPKELYTRTLIDAIPHFSHGDVAFN